jgi:potassium-transporting ATPase KdpC subunit
MMDPESRADMPVGQGLFASVKTWTAHLQLGLMQLGRETRTLAPVAVHALRLTFVLVVLSGVFFPLVIYGLGQTLFPTQANGSLVRDRRGIVIGSSLIGQQFTDPAYFHGRPSAVGYDGAGSGASNIGPTNPQLLTGNGSTVTVNPGDTPPQGATPVPGKPNTYYIPGSYLGTTTYAEHFRKENGLSADTPLPADIATASGSGLDPDISPEAAYLQVNRVVAARKAIEGKYAEINAGQLISLVSTHIEGTELGFLGEPHVNVLQLNLALDALFGPPPGHG